MSKDKEVLVTLEPPKLIPDIHNLCPLCFGSGTLRAMQKAKYLNEPVVRVGDTIVRCPICSGKGYREER